jgi:hypothetical protein
MAVGKHLYSDAVVDAIAGGSAILVQTALIVKKYVLKLMVLAG